MTPTSSLVSSPSFLTRQLPKDTAYRRVTCPYVLHDAARVSVAAATYPRVFLVFFHSSSRWPSLHVVRTPSFTCSATTPSQIAQPGHPPRSSTCAQAHTRTHARGQTQIHKETISNPHPFSSRSPPRPHRRRRCQLTMAVRSSSNTSSSVRFHWLTSCSP